MSRKRRGKISPLKVGAGLMTGGVSLLFTGIRKKNRTNTTRVKTTIRYKVRERNPGISDYLFLKPDSSKQFSQINRGLQPKIKVDKKLIFCGTWYLPNISVFWYILAIAFFAWAAYMSLSDGSATIPFFVYIIFHEYALLLFFSLLKKYLRIKEELISNCSSSNSSNIDSNKIYPSEMNKEEHFNPEIQSVDSMQGHEFERFIADLLVKLGYQEVSVTRGSGDQGVDVLAELNGIKYAIQCKNYSSALGNTPVQEVSAGKDYYDCHVGVVVTNNYFTSGGKELAKKVKVILWDRDKLIEMIESAKNK